MVLTSEDTLHQKLTFPGPTTVVSTDDLWLSPMVPLCAALAPSCVTLVCVLHGASPPVTQPLFQTFVLVFRA